MRGRGGWVVGVLVVCGVLGVCPGVAWGLAPEVPVTEAPGSVTGTTATFRGELNPGVGTEKLSYRFAYSSGVGVECGGSGVTAPREAPFPEAEGNHQKVSLAVTGLEGSTSYSVCLVAVNAAEESMQGSEEVFTTAAAKPVVLARTEAGSVTPFDAVLEAEINPENFAGTYRLEYSASSSLAGAMVLVESTFPKSGEVQDTGPVETGAVLSPATTYYYRVVATNATGTTTGPIEHFETQSLVAPVISEVPAATGVEQTKGFVSALIDPEFQETTGRFEYGLTEGYGSEAAFGPFGGVSSGSPEDVGAELGGLTANTVYHYRVVAENGTGPIESADETLLTLPNPPTAVTGEAVPLTTNSERISGVVDPENEGQPAQDATTYSFQYGRTPSYGQESPATPGVVGEGTSPVQETATLQGLEAGVLYHYRVLATNNSTGTPQTVYGEERTFTTEATPTTPPTLTGVTAGASQTTITVAGEVDTQDLPTRVQLAVGAPTGGVQPVAATNTSTPGPISLTAENLAPGTVYDYTLTVTGADGTVEASGQTQTLPAPPPALQLTLPPVIPAPTVAELDAREAKELKTIPNHEHPTNQQLLTKALKHCHKLHNTKKRQVCERQAHRKYPTPKKKH
jgi:phosphodiesterase/alkaline phosphatase D-like protein